jgi:hypothetical protein
MFCVIVNMVVSCNCLGCMGVWLGLNVFVAMGKFFCSFMKNWAFDSFASDLLLSKIILHSYHLFAFVI